MSSHPIPPRSVGPNTTSLGKFPLKPAALRHSLTTGFCISLHSFIEKETTAPTNLIFAVHIAVYTFSPHILENLALLTLFANSTAVFSHLITSFLQFPSAAILTPSLLGAFVASFCLIVIVSPDSD